LKQGISKSGYKEAKKEKKAKTKKMKMKMKSKASSAKDCAARVLLRRVLWILWPNFCK